MGTIRANHQLRLYVSPAEDTTLMVAIPFGDTQNKPIMLYGCVANEDYQSASIPYAFIETIQHGDYDELRAHTINDDPLDTITVRVGGYLKPFKSIWGVSAPECGDYYTHVPQSISAHHYVVETDVVLIVGTSYRGETGLFALNVAELRRGSDNSGGMRYCQWTKIFV
jgi:hypothetical protein